MFYQTPRNIVSLIHQLLTKFTKTDGVSRELNMQGNGFNAKMKSLRLFSNVQNCEVVNTNQN